MSVLLDVCFWLLGLNQWASRGSEPAGDGRPRTAPPDDQEWGFVILGGAFCIAMVTLAGWLTARG